MSQSRFRKELESLINSNLMENGSDTPDFILAEYLSNCLVVFDSAVKKRDKWYGFKSLSEKIKLMENPSSASSQESE